MERQREAHNLIIFLLTIIGIHFASSSNQNAYTFATTIDIGSTDQVTDHFSLRPLNATTSIYQESTTYLPFSASTKAEETNVAHRYAQPSYRPHEEHVKEADNSEESSDHVTAYSEHEETRDVPTRPKYVAPGVWAKPPPDENKVPLDFVPTKMHTQVRGTHVVKKVPQREAIESAETDEEKRNAHRLREVVTNSKVNTVYTEEGYEDSAYDHAGHVRDADFHEGFARKLHDRKKSDRNSSSGKKKEKYRNLVPDELEDYEEDYKDHLEESRKLERNSNDEYNLIGYGGSEIDPKLVAENGIRNLEEDIEKDAEETERSSQIYRKTQESKLHDDDDDDDDDDVKTDSSESEESSSHGEDDLKDEENKPTNSEGKHFKLKNKKANFANKGTKQSRGSEKKKHENRHGTTVLPFDGNSPINIEITPANLEGRFATNPSSWQTSVDQTTLPYVAPITTAPSQIDEPTTISYSQLFWNYFKEARQTPSSIESSTLASRHSSTANSRPEERTPIAVATIDGHGPYLLVTQEETTTSPFFTLFDTRDFRQHDPLADRAAFGASSAPAHNRHLLGRSDDVDNVIVASTTATFTTVQPLVLQPLSFVNPKDPEYSSTIFPDSSAVSSSTPTVVTLNMTQEEIVDYKENPFLSSILDNSNVVVTRNKIKYKLLVRPEQPGKVARPITDRSPYQQSPSWSTSQEEDEYKRIRDESNGKYNNKILDSIKSKRKSQFLQEKKKVYPKDLTLMRPPTAQQVVHSIFSINRPSVDHSNVESELSRESSWRSLLQDQPVKLRVDSYNNRSPHLPYKNSLPSTRLLPPPPPPPPHIANIYGNYRNGRQSDSYSSYIGGKQQSDGALYRYLPAEASWRTRSRRKRSDDAGEFRERSGAAADVKAAAANNTVTNDGKSERLDEGSFSRVTDGPKGKSASRGIIDRLSFPARSRESGTSATTLTSEKNNTVAIGESEKNAEENARETMIDDLKARKRSTLTRSENGRENDTNAEELPWKKRDVSQGRTRSKISLKNRDGKSHEELLNESPKVSGDVIDKEIAARFNEKDGNKTSSAGQEKGEVEIHVPSFDYVEVLAEDSLAELSTTTESPAVDSEKYPFYRNENVPSASALKYIVDPETIPRKTSRGMEFYNSRNAYKQCDAVEPALDTVLPEKEEPDPERGPQEDLPRLRGLGDKLDCLKAKYFDENPLDNPLFAEKLVADPTPPSELNSTEFVSQILELPKQRDEYVVQRVSKKPERDGRQLWNRPRETQESIRVNYKYDPRTGRGRNAYMYSVRNTVPHETVRGIKNRKSRPRSSITTTTAHAPKKSQTAFYQNQVYEDVMGNIRHLAKEIYEKTTSSPATQILETAGSENTLQIVHITPSPPKEKGRMSIRPNVTEVNTTTIGAKSSSEIKGLLPPPKYLTPRQSTYRKHRPSSKSRISLLRSPSLPRIIAHAIKINKRSLLSTNDITNSSESMINETAAKKSAENSTIVKSVEETTTKANWTPEAMDLEIAESKQSRGLPTTLKVEDKKRRKNLTSDDQKSESSPRIVYTIRDRIRHSKPKWDTTGFGKFNANSRTTDEDKRRKEPRYNQFARKKKPIDGQRNDSAPLNSTDTTETESAKSSIEGEGESGPGDVYRSEESAVHQTIYHTKKEYGEPKKQAESVVEKESEENTTNSYEVRENIDEDVSTTTVQDLREYLEGDPPGYAEAFSEEEATTIVNHAKHEDEDTNYPKNRAASPRKNDDSSEKAEEQVETPIETDDSEEVSSKEEEGPNTERTFFTYGRRLSSIENDREQNSGKASFYRRFPFSRYKSQIAKESDESEEDSEERSEDYVFPWHADKRDKENRHRWLQNFDRFEYPWERRERLARERQRKQKRANRIRELIFGDENEEESTRQERPIYPWEKYDVPSKFHVNTRRDVSRDFSRRNIDDREESSTERLPFTKFSSRYSSSRDLKPQKSFTAREISKSIKKFLEEDDDESKEEISKGNEDRFSPRKSFSNKEIFKEKKSRKRKIPQANKNVSNSTSFDSNGLKNKETSENEAENETKYVKLNKTNESESQVKIASKLPNSTEQVPSTTEKRKKRRRKISTNNSTIRTSDSAPAESTRRKRRKPLASTTTPAVIIDLDTSKSVFVPVQKRYSNTDEAVKRNELNSPEGIISPEISKAKDLQVETSTPKTRTIEHRSRVSKEKIARKTIYPDEGENLDFTKENVTFARGKPTLQKLKIKLKRRKENNNEQDAHNRNPDDKKLIKQRGEENDSDVKIGEIKKSMLLEKTQDRSKNDPLKNLGIDKEEIKEINGANIYDEIINDENDNDDFRMPPETYAVSNLLLRNVPPSRVRNDPADERTESILRLNKNREHESREERDEDQEMRRALLQTKVVKDPERRLYYYVDRK